MSPATLLRFACVSLLLAAQAAAAPLQSVREIRELDRKVAAKRLPVQVKGVVSFVIPVSRSFIIDDGDTAIFVSVQEAGGARKLGLDDGEPMQPGTLVEVSGVSSPGGFAPVIIPEGIRRLGAAPLPPAKPAAAADLQTGRFDCERVRVRGVIQHAEFSGGKIDAARLELNAVGGHFVAYASKPDGFDPAKLVDAEVELSGVALTFFNERSQIVGARVQLAGIEDVEIVRASPASPFDAPVAEMDNLLPFSAGEPLLHRRRLNGVVTVSQPGSCFYIQEGERAVRVSTRDQTPLAPGDRVEVSGFVEMRESFAEICEAVFRKTGTAAVPAPEPITRQQVLVTKPWMGPPLPEIEFDGRRVVLRGRLDKVAESDRNGRRLSLDCDGYIVAATLTNDEPRAALERLVPGSEVAVTGVCQVQLSVGQPTVSNPVPTGFQLLVHSPADVSVLRVPPWWTPHRLWFALGGTVAVLSVALAWVWLLRRQVAQRSAQLTAEIGARRNAAVEFEAGLKERKRLAADLHDTLEQALTGLALQLEAVDLFQSSDPPRSTRHLHLARQFLARSREDVRRSVWNLRAQGLEGRTFLEALREMAVAQGYGREVRIAVESSGDPMPIPDFVAGNLLLLAQEAVTNALKHAAAETITLRADFEADAVLVEIRDDGRGFDPAHAPGFKEGHFGVQGMRERVKRLGGTLEVGGELGRGARIAARVPTRAFETTVES